MTNSLLSLSPTSSTAPDFKKFPYEHDFILDGRPQTFARNSDGRLIPAIGAEVTTRYGSGYIERRQIGGDVVVRITEFDETVEIAQYANAVEVNAFGVIKGYVSGQEQVAILSDAYNNRLMNKAIWFETCVSDILASEALMELVLDADCYLASLNGSQGYLGATSFIYNRSTKPRATMSTPARLAHRAKIEALTENDSDGDEMPAGMADELAECYGD